MAARRMSSLLSSSNTSTLLRSLGNYSSRGTGISWFSMVVALEEPITPPVKIEHTNFLSVGNLWMQHQTFPTRDPRTGQLIANVGEWDIEDVNRAVAAAHKAFDEGPTHLLTTVITNKLMVYVEVDKVGEQILKEPEKSLTSLLGTINVLFLDLKTSIGHVSAIRQTGSSVDGSYSLPLLFEKLPGMNEQGSQWTDCAIRDNINSIYLNLGKLDGYLSLLLVAIKDELFETFRKRHRGVIELEEVQLTSNSLHRLVGELKVQLYSHIFNSS